MIKEDLIQAVQDEMGRDVTRAQVEAAIDAVMNGIRKGLAEDRAVQIHGFGSFTVSDRAPREGRNPATGEPIQIPAQRVVQFKPGKNLKESL